MNAVEFTPIVERHTGDKYEYQLLHTLEAGHEKAARVSFSLRANNDAHIALGSSLGHADAHWEIVLGGWGNSASVIRDRNQGPNLVEHKGTVLNPNQPLEFWLEWDEKELRVGKGGSVQPFLKLARSHGWDIKYMLVCTAWGSRGDWWFREASGGDNSTATVGTLP